jgi:hypothetical protein
MLFTFPFTSPPDRAMAITLDRTIVEGGHALFSAIGRCGGVIDVRGSAFDVAGDRQ